MTKHGAYKVVVEDFMLLQIIRLPGKDIVVVGQYFLVEGEQYFIELIKNSVSWMLWHVWHGNRQYDQLRDVGVFSVRESDEHLCGDLECQ